MSGCPESRAVRPGGVLLWNLGALLLALLAGCAQRDLGDLQQFVETTKRTTPVKRPDPPTEIKP